MPQDKQDKPVLPSQGRQEGNEPVVEATVPLSAVNAMVEQAVATALAKRVHQPTPIDNVLHVEMSGRTREEGQLVVSKLDETKGYTEWGFNDGTVRRDYK